MPDYVATLPLQARDLFLSYLRSEPHGGLVPPDSVRLLFVEGDARFGSGDSILFQQPLLVVASGNLTLEGRLSFQPYSRFVAGDSLNVRGEVRGRNGMFFSANTISVGENARCSGQFLAMQNIEIEDEAYLRYPSLLYVYGTNENGGRIDLSGRAVVDGTIVYPPPVRDPYADPGRIIIGSAATVRGAVYNAGQTQLDGSILGTLMTHQFHFYVSPTDYVNWLKDASIDRYGRPDSYLMPVGFSARPRLAILLIDDIEANAK